MENRKMMFKVTIHYNDLIVEAHTVNGERILPGATYFDLILRFLLAKGIDLDKVRIRNWVAYMD